MKKAVLVYNPIAGAGDFPEYLDDFLGEFQDDYRIIVHRTKETPDGSLQRLLCQIAAEQASGNIIMVAGGDGTLNRVVNIMMNQEIDLPLGIIPAGTVNDFASYLNMPDDYRQCFELIARGKKQSVDVGLVNDRYFINVCVGGVLAEIPHDTETVLKNKLGKLAYYLRGIKEVSSFESMKARIVTGDEEIEQEIFLFLILNTTRSGGFKNLSPEGKIDDGLFELILVKAGPMYKVLNLAVELFQNKHLDNEDVYCTKGDRFQIEVIQQSSGNHFTDIDGQKGPSFPLEVKVIPQGLTVFRG